MMLKYKVAVIYGAGGAIGGAVARAFASEGAKVFLSGRKRAPLEAVAQEIQSAGGSAEAAEVDALDEQAVDKHLQSVIDKAGRVDISFNAIGIPPEKILGVPLIEMDVEQFAIAIASYTRSYFLTARLAARRMVQNKSGVIMTITALPSRKGTPLNGGYGSAQAARRHSLETYPPNSHLRAFAWSLCDHMACRRQARSGKSTTSKPRQRA
jgi:NAD(P)-dependent dehydrogenase (short-subunit alcohol dehydrogenase family)